MQTYNSRETVKARKVTNKDGETVVTSAGPIHAAKGTYIVLASDGQPNEQGNRLGEFRVLSGDEFNARYTRKSPKKAAKKSAPKAEAKPAKDTPAQPTESAVERVKARVRDH